MHAISGCVCGTCGCPEINPLRTKLVARNIYESMQSQQRSRSSDGGVRTRGIILYEQCRKRRGPQPSPVSANSVRMSNTVQQVPQVGQLVDELRCNNVL